MKLEMHSHIKEQSSDSLISASKYVTLLKNVGYNGIVITDHFSSEELSVFSQYVGIEEKCKSWLRGYRAMKDAAVGTDLVILLGMEYTVEFLNECTHILLYGLTEQVVESGIIRPNLSPNELRDICLKHDIIMIQAHPYRHGNHKLPESLVDGYEIFNSKPMKNKYTIGYNERIQNDVKDSQQLIKIGGGDCHHAEDVGRSGIDTEIPVHDIKTLKVVLRDQKFKVIT